MDPFKAMYIPDHNALLISDLHVGKAGHFRKNGIALPETVGTNNMWNLSALMDRYEPSDVYFMGDLCHSHSNEEVGQFADWKAGYSTARFTLIRGNHDILPQADYIKLGLEVADEQEVGPFRLIHDLEEMGVAEGTYTLSGHIHPCVRLVGNRRVNTMRLPCFWFAQQFGVLPAFGDFTGTHRVRPRKGDEVYVCAGKTVKKF